MVLKAISQLLFSIRYVFSVQNESKDESAGLSPKKIYVLSSLSIVCEIVIRLFDVKNCFSVYKWKISFKYRQLGRISLLFGYFSHFCCLRPKKKRETKNVRSVAYICLIVVLKVRRHSRTFHYLWMQSSIIRKEASRIFRISYASWYLSL